MNRPTHRLPAAIPTAYKGCAALRVPCSVLPGAVVRLPDGTTALCGRTLWHDPTSHRLVAIGRATQRAARARARKCLPTVDAVRVVRVDADAVRVVQSLTGATLATYATTSAQSRAAAIRKADAVAARAARRATHRNDTIINAAVVTVGVLTDSPVISRTSLHRV